MRWLSTLVITALAMVAVQVSAAAGGLRATDTFASDAEGNPVEVKVGDTFFCTVRMRAEERIEAPYVVRFDTPFDSLSTPRMWFGQSDPGPYQVTWGPMKALLDRPFELKATIRPADPGMNIRMVNNSCRTLVVPKLPGSGAEYFNPQQLVGIVSMDIRWSRPPGVIEAWFPVPQSESSQIVRRIGWANPPTTITDRAAGIRLQSKGNSLSLSAEYHSTAASQRVNRHMLRSSTFTDYAHVTGIEQWLEPEFYVESRNPWVEMFALAARKNAQSDTPFDIAESIYKALLLRCNYASKPVNIPSAWTTLRTRKGDCGGLSSLFVAACRSQGIPARGVVGFVIGEDNWHVWAEFYLSGYGWIACDPAYAKGAMPRSTLPLYFGIVPELRDRIACTFGFDTPVLGRTLPLLQAPTVFWSDPTARASHAVAHCRVSPAN